MAKQAYTILGFQMTHVLVLPPNLSDASRFLWWFTGRGEGSRSLVPHRDIHPAHSATPPLWSYLSLGHNALSTVVHEKWTGCSFPFLGSLGTCLTAFLYSQCAITLGDSILVWVTLKSVFISLFLSSPHPQVTFFAVNLHDSRAWIISYLVYWLLHWILNSLNMGKQQTISLVLLAYT